MNIPPLKITIAAPREIPREPGCLVVRAQAPAFASELEARQQNPAADLWRFTLWQDGRMWFGLIADVDDAPPTLEELQQAQRDHPEWFCELTRPAAS